MKDRGKTRMDRISSDGVRERLRQLNVLDTALRKKRQGRTKIEEMSEERLAKTVCIWRRSQEIDQEGDHR